MPDSDNHVQDNLLENIKQLTGIGISLSAEKNTDRLLEKILISAQNLTHSDGGTLYLLNAEDKLTFEIMRTRSLGIALGGSTQSAVQLAPISLYDDQGNPNNKTIAAYAALTGEVINIKNAYSASNFNIQGTKDYDKKTGYHSKSFLTLPMKNHENQIIGVLQLINAIDMQTGDVIAFSAESQRLAESLASQAAVALTNHQLISDLRVLLERFIEVIAGAIDEKSPYTGGHCRRVPEIAMLLAKAVHNVDKGEFADLRFSDQELYELKIAALMHDCGKITTPIHVVDKATKLETIYDRIKLIETRFALLKRDAEIVFLQENMSSNDDQQKVLRLNYEKHLHALDEELEFLRTANIGSEFMSEEKQLHVKEIAKRRYRDINGEWQPLLTVEETYNLTIAKGTLTKEERHTINYHMQSTINMLEKLPFPKQLKNVPEIAGGHHERMDGKGYPLGLTKDQMSVQARIMGIADIFEALTAADRPYKKAMPVSQALNILGKMKLDSHIDPDLFDVFLHEKVYEDYARNFLSYEQIDDFDTENLPGFNSLN
ncbi:MAG: GAF domain-containing protein [Sulfuriflexus sp.]|nr:GAF domain-containing protein [Sulfuriflexus sp.]